MKGIELCADCAYYNMKSHKCTRGCKIDPDTKKGDDIHFFVDCLLPDVQPLIHAYWIELPKALNPNENPCKCSNCGHVLSFMNYYPKSKYCPNCGARMDLKDGDTNG